MKKFLFSIICTLLPILASAQEPYAVLSNENTVLTFYYDNNKESRGGMDVPISTVPTYNLPWYSSQRDITSVVFDSSFSNCTTITSTSGWFSYFNSLESITGIENLNTDNVTDMSDTFRACEKLSRLDVSRFNTQKVIDISRLFLGCSSLTNLDVSNFNTSNVTDMTGMFGECPSLTSIDVRNFDTSKVTSMRHMFQKCSSLTSLDLSNFNTSNVIDMAYMFYETTMTNLNITNFDTSNVNDMEGMFRGCTFSSIDVSHFNTSNVTNMAQLFEECYSLTSINLSNFNTSNVTNMDAMFMRCSSLEKIYVGNKWTTSNVSSSIMMFEGCTSLVGGSGTTYDSSHTDASYAHIDGGSSNPGYLTSSEPSQDEQYWVELRSTIDYGVDVLIQARNSSSVDPWMIEELEMFLQRGNQMYNEHTADEEEVRHMIEELNWIIREVEEAMRNQPDNPHSNASFDGLTAWVYGSATLDDAFASVGGRSEAARTIAAIVWNADDALTSEMLSGITNPNLLVYVTEASKAPSGVQNLIINGTAAEIILTDASGNNNFYCPQSFTAQSISYTRSFSQTTQIDVCQGWETISLPFTVQSIRHQTNGALVPFGAGNNGYPFWLRQLSNSGLSRATAIEANRPYLICMPNNTVYPSNYNQAGNITFSATNVTVPVTSDQTASGAGVTLRPAFQQVAQSGSVYALNVGEARGEYPEGSVFERNYREIRPFQAYTSHGSGTRFITVSSMGGGDDGFTGIESIDSEDTDDNGTWHTLDGRRLEGKPVKKGVYIKDGRKYIIK